MKTPWTQIEDSRLWRAAAEQYSRNNLPFHNLDHIRDRYKWAAELKLPYSLRLDENILAHDLVMDRGRGENERASALWLIEQTGREPEWASPILSTIDHRPREDQLGLAMLDLMDFSSTILARMNTEKLRREAIKVKGAAYDQSEWLMGTMGYLNDLRDRIQEDLGALAEPEQALWSRISRGIAITMACAPHRYDPHPASGITRYTEGMEATLRFAVMARGPINAAELAGLPGSVPAHITGLVHFDMLRAIPARGALAHWEPTEAGRDWVARMNAAHPSYPEPDLS